MFSSSSTTSSKSSPPLKHNKNTNTYIVIPESCKTESRQTIRANLRAILKTSDVSQGSAVSTVLNYGLDDGGRTFLIPSASILALGSTQPLSNGCRASLS
jgi:predicted component of type VI protein secretion system